MNTVLFAAARHAAFKASRSIFGWPPRSYPFASGVDARVYRRALAGEPLEGLERPIVIIQGPTASGKSHMVRSIIAARYGDAHPWSACPNTEREYRQTIENAIRVESRYVWLDGVRPLGGLSLRSHAVAHYATASGAELRGDRTHAIERYTVLPQIFITCEIGPISQDLLRRSYLIRLDPSAAADRAA